MFWTWTYTHAHTHIYIYICPWFWRWLGKESPGEIKRREVSWTLTMKLDSFAGSGQVSPEEIKSKEMELGLRVGLLSLQLFPTGGATDVVFVTLFRIAVGTAIAPWYGSCCAMPGEHCRNILLLWRRSTAALVFRVGGCK